MVHALDDAVGLVEPELACTAEVTRPLGDLTLGVVEEAAIEVGLGEARVELYGLVVVLEGAGLLP